MYEGQGTPSVSSRKIFSALLLFRRYPPFLRRSCPCFLHFTDKLRRFTGFPLLKRLALLVLARLLPDEDMAKQLVRFLRQRGLTTVHVMIMVLFAVVCGAQEWFHNIDRGDIGYITHQDLMAAARDRGIPAFDREVCRKYVVYENDERIDMLLP